MQVAAKAPMRTKCLLALLNIPDIAKGLVSQFVMGLTALDIGDVTINPVNTAWQLHRVAHNLMVRGCPHSSTQ